MDPLPALVSVVLTAAIVIPLTIAAVFARQLLRIARLRRASARLRPGSRVAEHEDDHEHDHDHPAEREHPER
ncbi:hypothetical protein ELQ90_15645 [Labedella phragmitis]|uniref:Uncharacterized protein n=1 Tax=Labedella phragmitis TaxID=2498849 RepID=A0A3S3ZWG8_9MICO|nr:hypothetical protein [Labedella phragmitis]RWZ46203.1 hypothetical protein ELQ90_15645 [Labedella phragmitis]